MRWGFCGSTVYITKTKMFYIQAVQKAPGNADVHVVLKARDIDLCEKTR